MASIKCGACKGTHDSVELVRACYEYTEVIEDTGLKCLNRNASTPCQGEVYERPSLTGTGKWIARCDFHYDLRVQEEDKRTRAGVYDVNPPEWFDPAAAGETW